MNITPTSSEPHTPYSLRSRSNSLSKRTQDDSFPTSPTKSGRSSLFSTSGSSSPTFKNPTGMTSEMQRFAKGYFTEISPETSPLNSPTRKMKSLSFGEEQVPPPFPPACQEIIEKMSSAVADQDIKQLKSLFSECKQHLSACAKAVIDDLWDDDDVNFFNEQLTSHLQRQFNADDTQAITCILFVQKNKQYSFFEKLSPENKQRYEQLKARVDIPQRLLLATQNLDNNAVRATCLESYKLGLTLDFPNNLSDVAHNWLRKQVEPMTIITSLMDYSFQPIYNTLLGYKVDNQVTDDELLTNLSSLIPQLESDPELQHLAPRLRLCLSFIEKLTHNLEEKRTITFLEKLRIAFFAAKMLENKLTTATYFPKNHEHLERAIIINPNDSSFIILSGKDGKIAICGEERFVSNATLISSHEAEVQQFVYLVNLLDDRSKKDIKHELVRMRKQVNLAKEINNDIYLTLEHKNELIVVEKKYAGPLEKAPKFSAAQTRQLLSVIAEKLTYMHSKGYMHGDLNRRNIVYDINDETVSAKIIDFGCTYSKQHGLDLLDIFETSYGTVNYSAPEFFSSTTQLTPHELQSCDMYAVGCILYELLTGKEVPDSMDKNRFLNGELMDADWPDTVFAKATEELKQCQDNELAALCVELLTPDSSKRLSAKQLNERMQQVQL